ncbi:MAG: cardiolipin synthase [Phycisphaerales bacterium]
MAQWLALGYVVGEWVIRAVMLVVVPRRRPPTTALSWLVVIYFLPWVGVFLFLLIGDTRLGRTRLARHDRAQRAVAERVCAIESAAGHEAVIESHRDIARLAETMGGHAPVAANRPAMFADSDAMIEQLCADIDGAENFVHLLYYIFVPDDTGERVCAALERAAARSVACRVLADGVGSKPLFRARAARLRKAGVEVRAALPVNPLRRFLARIDLRNHRKVAVIDGRIGYTGSQNIVNPDYGKGKYGAWRDLSVRMEGPVVASLQRVFVEDWCSDTRELLDDERWFPDVPPRGSTVIQAVPSGPSGVSGNFRDLAVAIIAEAEERVIITSPYLIPDDQLMLSLRIAVLRGVEAHVVIPARPDHWLVAAAGRSYLRDLLDAGVHIHFHTDGLLHAKTLSVDDTLAVVGTANFDIRSFAINFELSLVAYGRQATEALVAAQRGYIEQSRPADADAWRKRPEWKQAAENIARLMSPLL